MGKRIMWSRQEDVERTWVHTDREFSHRLITKDIHGSSFSFHITTYVPFFETIVKGDGVHEVVLFCMHGWSKQVDSADGREHIFRPGDAMYLPIKYEYHHTVGDAGLVIAVSCTPSRVPGDSPHRKPSDK